MTVNYTPFLLMFVMIDPLRALEQSCVIYKSQSLTLVGLHIYLWFEEDSRLHDYGCLQALYIWMCVCRPIHMNVSFKVEGINP